MAEETITRLSEERRQNAVEQIELMETLYKLAGKARSDQFEKWRAERHEHRDKTASFQVGDIVRLNPEIDPKSPVAGVLAELIYFDDEGDWWAFIPSLDGMTALKPGCYDLVDRLNKEETTE